MMSPSSHFLKFILSPLIQVQHRPHFHTARSSCVSPAGQFQPIPLRLASRAARGPDPARAAPGRRRPSLCLFLSMKPCLTASDQKTHCFTHTETHSEDRPAPRLPTSSTVVKRSSSLDDEDESLWLCVFVRTYVLCIHSSTTLKDKSLLLLFFLLLFLTGLINTDASSRALGVCRRSVLTPPQTAVTTPCWTRLSQRGDPLV